MAQRAYAELRASCAMLVTTQYVLLECGNAAARTTIRDEVVDLRIRLTRTSRLISPSEDDVPELYSLAWQDWERVAVLPESFRTVEWSLMDCS
jgi:hypothetical protein